MHNSINSLGPRRDRRHFADDIFKCVFLNENQWSSLRISLKFVPKVRMNTFPALVQIMAWRRLGDKPLSEPMMVSLLTHICVTRPQWVNPSRSGDAYMQQWSGTPSVQVMAWRRRGAKPSPERMTACCQWKPCEHTQVNEITIQNVSVVLKYRQQPGFHLVLASTGTSTPIHARAWKEKALAGYNSQQIPTNYNVHKMLIIIISLRWTHFIIISYLYKIPTINEPYNQRKRDIRQTHTDILTA